MTDVTNFILAHGYGFLLLIVLADQAGLPVPAAPFLVAAGALARDGTLEAPLVLVLAVFASLVGHTAWYIAGRQRGVSVLRRVCRLSLEPDACVRRTQDMFSRLGPWSLIVMRFIPGLDTMAQPLAGMSGMQPQRYMLLNVCGALIWAGGCMGMGYIFGSQLEHLPPLRQWIAPALTLLFTAYVGWKVLQRYRLLRDTAVSRMSVDELKARLDSGTPITIIDLRHPLEAKLHPHTIPGAQRLPRTEVEAHIANLHPGQEVVLFCNCPHEIASALMAVSLARRGRAHVHPLEGGLDAWQERQYPLVPLGGEEQAP